MNKIVIFISKQEAMSTSEIKAKIHEMIDGLDDSFLRVVHSMLDTYTTQYSEVSELEKKILDQRLELHEQNPSTGKEWNQLKTELLG